MVEVQTRDVVHVEYRDRVVREQGPVRVVTRTVTTPGPAGPTVETVRVVEREKVITVRDSSGTATSDSQASTTRVEERDAPRLMLGATLGTDILHGGQPVYGGLLTVRAWGPLTVGAAFDSSMRATLVLGGSF